MRLRPVTTISLNTGSVPTDYGQSSTPAPLAVIIFFDVLAGLGCVVLLMTLLAALTSKDIKRVPAWYSLIVSGIIYDASHLLLLGNQRSTARPPFGLCVTQAGLVYAGNVGTVWAGAALVFQLYFHLREILTQKACYRYTNLLLLLIPHSLFLVIFAANLAFGILHPDYVTQSHNMFYHLSERLSTQVASALVTLASLSMIILTGRATWLLHRHWSTFRNKQSAHISPSTVIRIMIFSSLPVIATMIALVWSIITKWETGGEENLIPMAVPLAAGLIFGTQEDIIAVWVNAFRGFGKYFRRPPPPEEQALPTPVKIYDNHDDVMVISRYTYTV